MLRNLPDPEHPLTLEQLQVIELSNIHVNEETREIKAFFTPTIPNCSSANLIGLMIKIRLLRWVDPSYKRDVFVTPGSHVHEKELN